METRVKRFVSIPETRHLLGDIGHTTVYQLIKRREIVKVNIGRRGFITSESLEAYMDRLSVASAGGDANVNSHPQQDRDALEGRGLADPDDRADSRDLQALDAEEPMPS